MACANCPARAQDGERPGGLFDLIFGGSERMVGDRSVRTVEHTAQATGPDLVVRLERLESRFDGFESFLKSKLNGGEQH